MITYDKAGATTNSNSSNKQTNWAASQQSLMIKKAIQHKSNWMMDPSIEKNTIYMEGSLKKSIQKGMRKKRPMMP